MEESDTYLAILEEGQMRARRENILVVIDERFGPPDESIRLQLSTIADLQRLKRMHRHAIKDARDWQDILATP